MLSPLLAAFDDIDFNVMKDMLYERFRYSAKYPRKKKKKIRSEVINRLILINHCISIYDSNTSKN
jgi:hypothetical protein